METFHQCEWLHYLARTAEFIFQDSPDCKRVSLNHEDNGDCLQDWVLFCPGCGESFLGKTGTGLPGRPQMKETLKKMRPT